MIKPTEKETKEILRRALKRFEAEFGHMTEDERKSFRKWVASGNSPYDNPFLLYTGSGCPMDHITAARVAEDMVNFPYKYITEFEAEEEAAF